MRSNTSADLEATKNPNICKRSRINPSSRRLDLIDSVIAIHVAAKSCGWTKPSVRKMRIFRQALGYGGGTTGEEQCGISRIRFRSHICKRPIKRRTPLALLNTVGHPQMVGGGNILQEFTSLHRVRCEYSSDRASMR